MKKTQTKTIVVNTIASQTASSRCNFQYRASWIWILNNRPDIAKKLRAEALKRWPLKANRRNKLNYRINMGQKSLI